MQESPGLKPDLFVEIRSRYIKDVLIFFHKLEEVRSVDSLLEIVCHFFNELEQHFLSSILVEKSHFLSMI